VKIDNTEHLKRRIRHTVQTLTADVLSRVWQELK